MHPTALENTFLKSGSSVIRRILGAYGEIFIVNDWRFGAVIAALTFIHPNVGICGFLALFIALCLAYVLEIRQDSDWDSAYIRNVILIGLSVGYVFRLEIKTIPLLAALSVATFFLTIALKRAMSPAQLPLLSFALINILFGIVAQNYDHIYQLSLLHQAGGVWGPDYLPDFIKGFCNALSYVVFINNFWVGSSLALLILLHSRLLFLGMCGSYIFGVSLQAFKTNTWHEAFANPESYNYIYAGTLMSVLFLIPSLPSILMAAMTITLTVVFYDGLTQGLKVLSLRPSALPFNLAVLCVLQGIVYYRSKWRNLLMGRTPEESVERIRSLKDRFGYPDPAIELPFHGEWLVTQGFSGSETHLGLWRYAFDFVKVNDDHRKYQGQGLNLTDYPTYGSEVLSPCTGFVVALENHHTDNAIGLLNESKNWGNYIILRSDLGNCVSLCHLKQDSIRVKIGDYVHKRQVIAFCGNSGYSAEPHLHVQLQMAPFFDSPTVPFRIASYLLGDEIQYHAIPQVGSIIRPFDRNLALEYALVWASGRKFRFLKQDSSSNIAATQFEITTSKDSKSGRSYLCDGDGNRIYFWNQDGVFYFYDFTGSVHSLLAKIFLCVPRIPLTYSRHLTFTEYYPVDFAWRGLMRWCMQLGRIFGINTTPKGLYRLDPSGTILSGQLRFQGKFCKTEAVLDPLQGIKSFRIGDDIYHQSI